MKVGPTIKWRKKKVKVRPLYDDETREEAEKLTEGTPYIPDAVSPASMVPLTPEGIEEAKDQFRHSAEAQGCTCGEFATIVARPFEGKMALHMMHLPNCPMVC